LNWKFPSLKKIDASPIIAGNKVVLASKDGRVYLLDLKTGKKLWHYEIGKAITATPAVVKNALIVAGEDGNVYYFSGK